MQNFRRYTDTDIFKCTKLNSYHEIECLYLILLKFEHFCKMFELHPV